MIKTIIPTLMLTILAVLIQVVSPNKYLGMLIFTMIWNVLTGLSFLAIGHNGWFFTSIPSFEYSDLNGYGHFAQTTLCLIERFIKFLSLSATLAAACAV